MTTWAIKDWDKTFENYRSRELDSVRYVTLRTTQDSEAFGVLMRTKEGSAAFGVFIALVQIAAKCPVRGVLEDEKGAWDAKRYSIRFGLPLKAAEAAFDLLSKNPIGWLVNAVSEESRTDRASTAHRPTIDATPIVPYRKVRESTNQAAPAREEPEPAGGRVELSPEREKIADTLSKPPWALPKAHAREIAREYEPGAIRWTLDDIGRDKNARRPGRVLLARIASGALRELSDTHAAGARAAAALQEQTARKLADSQREKAEADRQSAERRERYRTETGKEPKGREYHEWMMREFAPNSPSVVRLQLRHSG